MDAARSHSSATAQPVPASPAGRWEPRPASLLPARPDELVDTADGGAVCCWREPSRDGVRLARLDRRGRMSWCQSYRVNGSVMWVTRLAERGDGGFSLDGTVIELPRRTRFALALDAGGALLAKEESAT